MKKIILTVCILSFGLAAYPQTATTPQVEAGKKVYVKNCSACHSADGTGISGLYPPLAKTDWVTGDKKRLINVLMHGLEDPITVNGEEYYNPMPAMTYLTDQEMADVLTYIRASFGNKASAIAVAEVKPLRPKKK